MRAFLFTIGILCLLSIFRNVARQGELIKFKTMNVMSSVFVLIFVLVWATYINCTYQKPVQVITSNYDFIEAATMYYGDYAFYYDSVSKQPKFQRAGEACLVKTPEFNRWYHQRQELLGYK